jgi:diadenosine tetraphosphatase ApaH/serine/threonine PP2A family protein phosphatase
VSATRYLVISDIHANLPALEAVLADAARAGQPPYDGVLCLGDLVGYGAEPTAVVERVMGLPLSGVVRGNHDKVAAGLESSRLFHDQARRAIEWTAATLTPDARAVIRAFPRGPLTVPPNVRICHGAPFDEDYYIFDSRDAWRALEGEPAGGLCLFGHTHVPAAFGLTPRGVEVLLPDADAAAPGVTRLEWRRDLPMLVNVGAVGQPRDGDPRAAYGIIDEARRTIEFHRVEYDIAAAQARIRAAGLPERLASRLDRGN